jgi:hypothetical protein
MKKIKRRERCQVNYFFPKRGIEAFSRPEGPYRSPMPWGPWPPEAKVISGLSLTIKTVIMKSIKAIDIKIEIKGGLLCAEFAACLIWKVKNEPMKL